MGRYAEIFNSARKNDIKSINKSIEDVGRRYHAAYMTNMMFADDMDINHRALIKIQNVVDFFYKAVFNNYLTKMNAQDMLEIQCRNKVVIKQDFTLLNSGQLLEIVYQQAMSYYFNIDIKNQKEFSSFFEVAKQYRIMSNFFYSDIERILIKMYEDIEIVALDTQNIDFLMRNYKKLDGNNDKYKVIAKQLVESIRNVMFRDNRLDDEYFSTVRQISCVLQRYF